MTDSPAGWQTKRNETRTQCGKKQVLIFDSLPFFFFVFFMRCVFCLFFCSQLNWATFEILVGSLQKEPSEMLNL